MAVTNLAPPKKGSVIFRFEDLWCPEGHFRITLWRDYRKEDGDALNMSVLTQGYNLFDITSLTVNLRGRLITKLPIYEEEAENYFTEITTNGFEIGIYNTNSPADVLPFAPIIGAS